MAARGRDGRAGRGQYDDDRNGEYRSNTRFQQGPARRDGGGRDRGGGGGGGGRGGRKPSGGDPKSAVQLDGDLDKYFSSKVRRAWNQ